MANGLFGGGAGTSTDPYLVEDAKDLDAVRNKLSAHYKQVNNIDLSNLPIWEPIGSNYSNPFRGVYNGNGHTIDNMAVNKNGYAGLFGSLGGTCVNLGVTNCNIVSTDIRCGGIAGHTKNATIENCYSTGSVVGTALTGGIIGQAEGSTKIDKCLSKCDVTGTDSVGGLIGQTSATTDIIKNSFALMRAIKRKVGATQTNFGDIVGSNFGTIEKCYSLDTLEFVQL